MTSPTTSESERPAVAIAVANARRACNALYLEVPAVVAEDVQRKVEAAFQAYVALAPRWIPVAEQMPPDNSDSLAVISDEGFVSVHIVFYGTRYGGPGWWYAADGLPVGQSVTHWMPLPSPPEKT